MTFKMKGFPKLDWLKTSSPSRDVKQTPLDPSLKIKIEILEDKISNLKEDIHRGAKKDSVVNRGKLKNLQNELNKLK